LFLLTYLLTNSAARVPIISKFCSARCDIPQAGEFRIFTSDKSKMADSGQSATFGLFRSTTIDFKPLSFQNGVR